MEQTALQMFSQTVKFENEFIWVKPVCDFFQISYENQTRKIKTNQILANQSTKKSNSLMFSDNYQRVLLTKKGFVIWIQLINPNIVFEEIREKFVAFQELIMDFLYGSTEENEAAKIKYLRLQKMEKLQGRLSLEIRRMKNDLGSYLSFRFRQGELF